MAKIQLGVRPENFNKVVLIQLLDGSTAEISFLFKYRTKSEFGQFQDEVEDKAKKIGESLVAATKKTKAKNGEEEPAFPTNARIQEVSVKASAEFIAGAAEGWSLDDEFNQENIERLVDAFPGSGSAIAEAYRTAILEGRIKN